MTLKAIRERLVKYLQVADDKKVKAIYVIGAENKYSLKMTGMKILFINWRRKVKALLMEVLKLIAVKKLNELR